jgi:hypothetical protein
MDDRRQKAKIGGKIKVILSADGNRGNFMRI